MDVVAQSLSRVRLFLTPMDYIQHTKLPCPPLSPEFAHVHGVSDAI